MHFQSDIFQKKNRYDFSSKFTKIKLRPQTKTWCAQHSKQEVQKDVKYYMRFFYESAYTDPESKLHLFLSVD